MLNKVWEKKIILAIKETSETIGKEWPTPAEASKHEGKKASNFRKIRPYQQRKEERFPVVKVGDRVGQV